MRNLFLVLTLLATLTSTLHADESPVLVPSGLQVRQARARGNKIGGAILMGIGILHLFGATVAGSVMARQNATCSANPQCRNEDWLTPSATFAMAGVGGLFSVIGIPIYATGANQMARLSIEF